ncbi:cysteine proteinase inhibitor 1-like [Pyrus x bretschneideri]|uniref:cysteine proteinase inhibitor 1-like n=1 Tax=Pyrus x bretschneideri TaxID=225117 RepID=UPI0020301FDB|nr:cysteine proteinase inhibitor 1-like [Pyrus x bretschneideri]
MMRHQYCLPPAAVLALVAAAATVAHGQQVGGWKKIPNLKDPLVQEIANFAVSEYNKKSRPPVNNLTYSASYTGETQVVDHDIEYHLILEAYNVSDRTLPDPRFTTADYDSSYLGQASAAF